MDIKTLLEQLEQSAEALMLMAKDYDKREDACRGSDDLDGSMFWSEEAQEVRRRAGDYYTAIRIIKERAA